VLASLNGGISKIEGCGIRVDVKRADKVIKNTLQQFKAFKNVYNRLED